MYVQNVCTVMIKTKFSPLGYMCFTIRNRMARCYSCCQLETELTPAQHTYMVLEATTSTRSSKKYPTILYSYTSKYTIILMLLFDIFVLVESLGPKSSMLSVDWFVGWLYCILRNIKQ